MSDDITWHSQEREGVVFDVGALLRYLQQLPDQRRCRGIRYPLPFLMGVIILAKLAGEDKPSGIAEWIRLRARQLVAAFQCSRATVPSLNTIRRTLAGAVTAGDLQVLFNRYLHQQYGGYHSVQVVLDGKTVRGTIPKGSSSGVHLLAAYLPAEGVVLMQVMVDRKHNEVSAAPQIIEALDLRGRVVSGDAVFAHRDLSVKILAQGGHYLRFVKGNQPRLYADVAQFFTPPRWAAGRSAPPLPQTSAARVDKGHGRLEHRRLTVMADDRGFIDWPGLRQLFKLDRRVVQTATGEVTTETVYGITSLPSEDASAEHLLTWTRDHWGIENGLHYRRDVTLSEDAIRMSNPRQAETMAVLNNFVIGLVRKLGLTNLASAQRTFEAHFTLALSAYG